MNRIYYIRATYHKFQVLLLIPVIVVIHINSAASQQVKSHDWIGLEFTEINEIPFFKKVSGGAATLLPNHSFAIGDYVKDGRHYVFLKKLLPTGTKRFRIVQVLDPGTIRVDEEMNISGLCSQNGKLDKYVIAIVKKDTDNEIFKHIRKAWKIDLSKCIVTPIDPKGVTCVNEAYGL